jgi:hypothetical protein
MILFIFILLLAPAVASEKKSQGQAQQVGKDARPPPDKSENSLISDKCQEADSW